MKPKLIVCYYINRIPHKVQFVFNSYFAAIYKARAIFEQNKLATDVMDCNTGEIIAIFEPGNIWIHDEFEDDCDIMLFRDMPII